MRVKSIINGYACFLYIYQLSLRNKSRYLTKHYSLSTEAQIFRYFVPTKVCIDPTILPTISVGNKKTLLGGQKIQIHNTRKFMIQYLPSCLG